MLKRRDGTGGFLRSEKSLDSFGRAPDYITNGYITYALMKLKNKVFDANGKMPSFKELDLTKELESLIAKLSSTNVDKLSEDPYFVALCSAAMYESGDSKYAEQSLELARTLVGKQQADGSVVGAKTSITCSGGDSLVIETTAMTILAWLNFDEFAPKIRKSVDWLSTRCQQGRFGSTQATVLALKAIIAYDVESSRPAGSGTLQLLVDGALVDTKAFDENTKETLSFDTSKAVYGIVDQRKHNGKAMETSHVIEIVPQSEHESFSMPYGIDVSYHSSLPLSAPEGKCAVEVRTVLSSATLVEGSAGKLTVDLTNTQNRPLPMTIAIIGVPAGLELRHEQLKEYRNAGNFAFYEVQNQELRIYFRGMAPAQTVSLRFDVLAKFPGHYKGTASRAYLYYTDEYKSWSKPLDVAVTRLSEGVNSADLTFSS